MTQKLQTEVIIEIPSNQVLIFKDEFDRLQLSSEKTWWTLDDVMKKVSVSRKTFTDKVLLNPKFKNDLSNWTRYPSTKGEKYYFLASKMSQFLEDNFLDIMKEI